MFKSYWATNNVKSINSGTPFGGVFGIVLLGLLFAACRPEFSDKEIKGVLTVDKTQWGNDKLEIYDIDSKLTRFIYPGKKIIQIDQGMKSLDLTLMESGGVKLARLHIPLKHVNLEENKFAVEGQVINQTWDIAGQRQTRVLQVEYIPRTGFKECKFGDQNGLSGDLWEVVDVRYDYIIDFLNEVTKKPIGHFEALGEIKTNYKKVSLGSQCILPKKIIENVSEAFE
ncbi:MAG: hypothetical protein A4S09_04740 [Proteobacteria bacterium SG_bin7]|nr:MAG: hypothetical protein A4S09_04740 [Proteobacteria bacterium SG_bin7]